MTKFTGGPVAPGITIHRNVTGATLVLNTSDTDLIAVECAGTILTMGKHVTEIVRLNLTTLCGKSQLNFFCIEILMMKS